MQNPSSTVVFSLHYIKMINTCLGCQKAFTSKCSLKRHIITVHEKQRPYQCPRCLQRLSTKSTLERHIRLKHADSDNVPTTPKPHPHYDTASTVSDSDDDDDDCRTVTTLCGENVRHPDSDI